MEVSVFRFQENKPRSDTSYETHRANQGQKENHEITTCPPFVWREGRKYEKNRMKIFLIILPLIILTNHIQSHAVS